MTYRSAANTLDLKRKGNAREEGREESGCCPRPCSPKKTTPRKGKTPFRPCPSPADRASWPPRPETTALDDTAEHPIVTEAALVTTEADNGGSARADNSGINLGRPADNGISLEADETGVKRALHPRSQPRSRPRKDSRISAHLQSEDSDRVLSLGDAVSRAESVKGVMGAPPPHRASPIDRRLSNPESGNRRTPHGHSFRLGQ